MLRPVTAVLVLASALASFAVADRDLRLLARADLAATSSGGIAKGTLDLASRERPGGVELARVVATATDLDVTRDASGHIPEFRLVLVPESGAEADLGALRVTVRGTARLRLANAVARLGSRSLRDFERGVAQVRRSGTNVLSASIPRLAIEGAGRSVSIRRVFGPLLAVDRPRRSPGTWRVESVVDGAGTHRDRIVVDSPRLETQPVLRPTGPDYRVFLVDHARTRSVMLGQMERELSFGATFRLDQAKTAIPSGVRTVEEFPEGQIEIRLGDTVLVRGYMAPFPHISDRPLPARSAAARGSEELSAPGGGRARALAEARATVTETRRVQMFSLRALALDPAGAPFAVTAVSTSGTHTPLGTLAAADARGSARLSISTARGRELPGGLPWLSGQTLEVRSAAGDVVLSGKFPTIR